MKVLLLIITFLALYCSSLAQDVIFNLEAHLNGAPTSLDSIRINNLSNGSTLLIVDLPDNNPLYPVNLNTGALHVPDEIDWVRDQRFKQVTNQPGEFSVINWDKDYGNTEIIIYSLSGNVVFSERCTWLYGEQKQIQLNRSGIYVAVVKTPSSIYSFKALGTVDKGNPTMQTELFRYPTLKSTKLDGNFSFSIGDSLEVFVFKQGYSANPVVVVVTNNESFVFDLLELPPTFIDLRDNNEYTIVEIGDQTWMAENLAYLPIVNSANDKSYTSPKYYVYNFDGTDLNQAKETNAYTTYGVLYNWPAAKQACPSGWELPADNDWIQLERFIGVEESELTGKSWRGKNEGKSLKATFGWDNNGFGTDDFGFSAIAGGKFYSSSKFTEAGTNAYWWTSTEESKDNAWYRKLSAGMRNIYRDGLNVSTGISLRCIKKNTEASLPQISVFDATDITTTTAVLHASVDDDGDDQIIERGFYYSATNQDPGFDNLWEIVEGNTGQFSIEITDLEPNTTYYFRAYATNSVGTTLGEVLSFTTLKVNTVVVATLTVNEASDITDTSAKLQGTVVNNGGGEIYYQGFFYSMLYTNPEFNNGLMEIVDDLETTFSYTLTDLQPSTTYYYRAFADNEAGFGMSEVKSFTTKPKQATNTFIDERDGNEYTYVSIGGQQWMAENLAYLPSVTSTNVNSFTEPCYYVYGYEGTSANAAKTTTNYKNYGVLYNAPAAENACPSGWSLPSDEDWKQLEIAHGMSQAEADMTGGRGATAGIQMKAKTSWSDGQNGTDIYAFAALAGGRYESMTSDFVTMGTHGFWWTSYPYSTSHTYNRTIYANSLVARHYNSNKSGYSVRCVKGAASASVPSVNASNYGTLTKNSCELKGSISSDGGAAVTARGFYWSETNDNPGPNDNKVTVPGNAGEFVFNLTGLKANTKYYYNAFATNAVGTGVSSWPTSFTTPKESFTDSRDGHSYTFVKIGNQTWMAENLAYLPVVMPASEASKDYACYYVYGYNGTNVTDAKKKQEYQYFGVLYNLQAAKNACPSGWHLPTDNEWKELEIYIGMPLDEVDNVYDWRGTQGAKLKSSLTWAWIGGPGSDNYGFKALGSGMKDEFNEFQGLQTWGEWWTSTQPPGYSTAYVRILRNTSSDIWYTSSTGNVGLGVRCVKDK